MAPLEPAAFLAWLAEDGTRGGNFLEALLWLGLSVALLVRPRKPGVRMGALWFALFGVSDLIEMHTGAWWEPLELFVFKAACVVGLAAAFGAYRRATQEIPPAA